MSDTPTTSAAQSGELVKFEPKELTDLRKAAEELADMSVVDRAFHLPKKAEALSQPEKVVKSVVNAVLRERAMQAAAKRLEEDRVAKQQAEATAAKQREHDHLRKEKKRTKREADKEAKQAEKEAKKREAAAEKAAEQKAEREQRKAEKAAERKAKAKNKAFANLLKLPVDRHDGEIAKMAKRLGEDAAALHEEFKDFTGVADGFSMPGGGDTEPWLESVDIAELLQGVDAKTGKHVVMQPYQRTAVTLWVTMAWVHNDITVHSPILTATSAEPNSGKTELLKVVARLAPKPSMNVESTGPNVYRYVDAHKPTLIIDEADDLFTRKSDLKHIINASWTRGVKIPRQVSINGIWTTVMFDPFCPKALGLLGRDLPRTLKTRAIEIRMVPKRGDEVVEPSDIDDFEFATLRRKLARFAADNAAALKTIQPTFPAGMNNRAAANWKLLLAIAELAGGPWPDRAREAAERLTRSGRQPSDRVRLLAAFKKFADSGKTEITSEDVVSELCRNQLDIWVAYNKGGKITQRQVAHLLGEDSFGIHPVPLHPTKRKDFGRQGYKIEQFADAFARYLPEDPIIQSPPAAAKRHKAPRKKRKTARHK